MRPNIGEIQLRYMRENDWERLDRPLLGVVPDWRESFEMLIKYPHVGCKSVLQCANQCFMNVQFIIRRNTEYGNVYIARYWRVRRSENELDVNEWMRSWEAPEWSSYCTQGLDWTAKHPTALIKAWIEILPRSSGEGLGHVSGWEGFEG
jgi:hypothetical protein